MEGAEEMKQIIPCNVEMYAVYDSGGEIKRKVRVLAFGIDEPGYVIPLVFDASAGIDYALCVSYYEIPDKKPGPLEHIIEALQEISVSLQRIQTGDGQVIGNK